MPLESLGGGGFCSVDGGGDVVVDVDVEDIFLFSSFFFFLLFG